MATSRPLTAAQYLPHLARVPSALRAKHPELVGTPDDTQISRFFHCETPEESPAALADLMTRALEHDHARSGAWQADHDAETGVVTLTYWPQREEKEREGGNFKTVKLNCFEVTLNSSGHMDTEHLVSVSKKSKIYTEAATKWAEKWAAKKAERLHYGDTVEEAEKAAHEEVRTAWNAHIEFMCPKTDGWRTKVKLRKKEAPFETVMVAPWAGAPMLDHIGVAQTHLLTLFDDLLFTAQEDDFKRFDLKGSNTAVRQNPDGSYTFTQIDSTTASHTATRFPVCEANRIKLKSQYELILWYNALVHETETNPVQAANYYASNMIFLIFEIFDWDYDATIAGLQTILEHVETYPENYNEDFLDSFKAKVASFGKDKEAQWPVSGPTLAERTEKKARLAEAKRLKKAEDALRKTEDAYLFSAVLDPRAPDASTVEPSGAPTSLAAPATSYSVQDSVLAALPPAAATLAAAVDCDGFVVDTEEEAAAAAAAAEVKPPKKVTWGGLFWRAG